jgi:hypothetical protein
LVTDQKVCENKAKEIYKESEEDINDAISRGDGSMEKRRGYYVCPFCNTFLSKGEKNRHSHILLRLRSAFTWELGPLRGLGVLRSGGKSAEAYLRISPRDVEVQLCALAGGGELGRCRCDPIDLCVSNLGS